MVRRGFQALVFWIGLLAVALPSLAQAEPSARLIFFTQDGTEGAAPLLPGFPMHSVWSGLGQSADGTIYIAVSNHDEALGNVAIFALDPGADRMRLVGDLKSVSEAAGNWLEGEGQYKVHTFLQPGADGRLYFATMVATDPRGRRGAHLYALDPETEVITDLSATDATTVTRDARIVLGTGVAFEEQSIKGLVLDPSDPDVVYMMVHGSGALVRHNRRTGAYQAIGQSVRVAYVFHVDGEGDVYFLGGGPEEKQTFWHYDAQSGTSTALIGDLDPREDIGMIVETANPDIIMVLFARSKKVVPIHTGTEKVLRGGKSCGKNWWMLYNMAISPDGEHLYFVSNNNDKSLIWRVPVGGGKCQRVLDVDALLGTRNLAFGGQDVWVGDSFYTPVWTHEGSNDLAILEVTVK